MAKLKIPKVLLIVLLVVIIPFVLFEVYLQVSFPDELFAGKNAVGEMGGPGFIFPVVTNSEGIRETQDYDKEHSIDVFRVAVVGDSFVFGNSVPNEKTIDSVLERIGPNNCYTFEFLNFGIAGMAPSDYLEIMKFAEDKYAPDAYFVVTYLGNDYVNSCEKHNAPVKQILKKCKTCMLFFSFLVSSAKESDPENQDIPSTVYNKAKNEQDFLMRSLLFSTEEYNSQAIDAYEFDLQNLSNFSKQHNKQIYFIALPHPLQVSQSYYPFYENIGFEVSSEFLTDLKVQDNFAEICERNNFSCYDTSAEIINSPNRDALFWLRDEHFKEAGYVLVARLIADNIMPELDTC